MRANDLDPSRLRRLAGLKAPRGVVLSLYVDLDPTTFAAPPARQSQVTSLIDTADRRLRDTDLEHEARAAARRDLERADGALQQVVTESDGASGIALFACGAADLLELVRLPKPVDTRVIIAESPWIEPLVRFGRDDVVAVALVDRHHLRLFHGTRNELEELDPDAPAYRFPGDEGVLNEPRHPRANDHEVHEHLKRVSHALLALLKKRGYDCLLIGGPGELRSELQVVLHPYVRERFDGWLECPVDYAKPDEVRRCVVEALDAEHARQEDETLGRLREGLGRGERAAAGLASVLQALNERRVETLLYDDLHRLGGVVCRQDGWLGTVEAVCPVDGSQTERREDIVENAAETAVLQSAEVLALRDRPELGPYGGIAATLRF